MARKTKMYINRKRCRNFLWFWGIDEAWETWGQIRAFILLWYWIYWDEVYYLCLSKIRAVIVMEIRYWKRRNCSCTFNKFVYCHPCMWPIWCFPFWYMSFRWHWNQHVVDSKDLLKVFKKKKIVSEKNPPLLMQVQLDWVS